MKFELTREFFFQETDKTLNAITTPQFLEEIRTFRELKGDERVEFAKRRLVPQALENRGVSIPADMRISSRTFEDDSPSASQYIDFDRGERIIAALQTRRPELLEKLQRESPTIYHGLKLPGDVSLMPDPDPLPDPGPLPDPAGPLPDPTGPDFDGTVAAWGCACGGSLVGCAGGGGGTDMAPEDVAYGYQFDPSIDLPADYKVVLRDTYDELIDFVVTDEFKSVVEELYKLPASAQPAFVREVLLNRDELAKRGVNIPDGILLQRSSFGDGRQTLFVVKKFLPEGYQGAWENLNITFDQAYDVDHIARDATAWHKPMPFEVQAALQALDLTAEELEE